MSANHTLQTSAAAALVELLPTPLPLTAAPAASPLPFGAAAAAVSANFVGSVSADIALALVDTSSVLPAGGSGLVTPANVLRPAMENATAALGSGVLGECRTEDASALFSDPDTVVFELRYMETVAGWFGIRVRENGVLGGSGFPAATGETQVQHGSMAGKLGRINNVEMALTVEIGRTRMSVRDVLNLEPGGVVELDRSAGAPADVLLNGRVIAHGEVVVVDQDYAVRITRILDIADGAS
ncbi:flagellar motor switch protein FliN [Pseudarthrobacter phenanthrenivorans]|uniref:Flagellar motor switch protein FliN n=1 Tax=Pseudarthrobacter phenanthrenivorans TaxID=361575 RepID=A0A3B0FF96_PSEPS|nr:flagellar motor switch protein FliN [Pseudarthrobacter phenanthrenivorans]RKO21543.1 flagellar motor switch protein FliN [Pseudarthrobacter phenanthrenivorans]TPV52577.1 flagellar motor switch protein FliN [Pseudarthrobacter phenanthrenivorans]